MSDMHFIIYSRSYCHLCDDMLHALVQLRSICDFSVETIDIDEDPDLVQRYDELVPVLLGKRADQEQQQLCHYFLDREKVVQFLLGGS